MIVNQPRPRTLPALAITALLALLLVSLPTHAQESRLPSIGGAGGGLIAGQQESDIGQQVMVSIRRSAPRISDPLVYDYLSAICKITELSFP